MKRKLGQDVYNLFKLERQEGRYWLITNLQLASLEGDDRDEDTMRYHKEASLLVAQPCHWVFINRHEHCRPGDLVIGHLTETYDETSTLNICKKIKNESGLRL